MRENNCKKLSHFVSKMLRPAHKKEPDYERWKVQVIRISLKSLEISINESDI